MAPSSKSERGGASGGKRSLAESGRGSRREHVVRQLERVKVSRPGQGGERAVPARVQECRDGGDPAGGGRCVCVW